ncbi:MAG TPA: PepSY-associated TM helix domain-containing protein [Chryseolinea sp.]
MAFRKAIQRVHLWLGFTSGTLLVAVALTGCVLAFEDELRYATQHDVLYVEAENKPQLSVSQLQASLREYDAKLKLNQIRFYGDPTKATQCYTRDKKIVGVNPYNGKILGVRDTSKDWLSLILSFHRTLLLGKTGETIILCNVCIFLAMLLSGIVLWMPPLLKQWKHNLSLKRNLPPKRRNYEWHRMLGLYAWLPLLLIAITGISMASGGEKKQKLKSSFVSNPSARNIYDEVAGQVHHREPIDVLRVTFPQDSSDVIAISVRYETRSFRKQSTFSFDQYSGKLLKTELYEQKSFGQRFFGSNYEIHTGRIFGIPGKIIMFLAGLIALSLPITGFLIWKGKRTKASS